MNSLFSKVSNLASSVKDGVENSAFLKQHMRNYSDPSEYIDAQTARERMMALPLPPYCSWVNTDADLSKPLTLKIYSVRNIIQNITGLLVFTCVLGLVCFGFFTGLADWSAGGGVSQEMIIAGVLALVFLIFFLFFLHQTILAFYPKFVKFEGETVTVTRGLKYLYRDFTYDIKNAYIRAEVSNNQNSNENFVKNIIDTLLKDYHIYICDSLQSSHYRWSYRSRRLITVQSIVTGFKTANYFCELIHIQRLARK